jgi:hypothetical protein
MSKEAVVALQLRPGVHALTSVLSVLHARATQVAGLVYSIDGGEACLLVRCAMTDDEAIRLTHQLDRRVDVLSAALRVDGADD